MRFLFFLYDAPWPIRGGQQLHTYNMIQALVALGHDVHLAALGDVSDFPAHKHVGWSVSRLSECGDFVSKQEAGSLCLWFAARWMQYWGTPQWVPWSIDTMRTKFQADVVIVVGLQALPLAALIRDVPGVWYAADDWVLHHLTLAKRGPFRSRLQSLKNAMLSLCYERSLSAGVSGGAIAVSKRDRTALRRAGGFQRVSLIPNGVDADFFQPKPDKESEKPSICFWGRMDFEPNIEAMLWFCSQIWPLLLEDFPGAELTIVGTSPTAAVKKLGLNRSIRVTGEVDDVRPFAWDAQVAVMPILTGAGIKNKHLEACAMGKPVVASQIAVTGLDINNESSEPWIVARDKEDWVNAIKLLWTDRETRQRLGSSARDYVVRNYSWRQAAIRFVEFARKIK